jgi:hypothetical protein
VGESKAEYHMTGIANISWTLDHIIFLSCDKSIAEYVFITDMKLIKNILYST